MGGACEAACGRRMAGKPLGGVEVEVGGGRREAGGAGELLAVGLFGGARPPSHHRFLTCVFATLAFGVYLCGVVAA